MGIILGGDLKANLKLQQEVQSVTQLETTRFATAMGKFGSTLTSASLDSTMTNESINSRSVTFNSVAGSNDKSSIYLEAGFTDPDFETPQSLDLIADRALKAYIESTTIRLTTIGQQYFGLPPNEIVTTITTTIKAYEMVKNFISGIFGVNSKAKATAEKAVGRYEKQLKTAGTYLATVLQDFKTDPAHGDSININSNQYLCVSQRYGVTADSIMTFESPLIHEASQQTINTSRFYHVISDSYQGHHFYYSIYVDDLITMTARNTHRSNTYALYEASGEAEYIAGAHIHYGDVLWNQAGQDEKIKITDNIYSSTTLTYGTILNIAANNIGNIAKQGSNLNYSRSMNLIEAPFVIINSGYGKTIGELPLKAFAPLNGVTDSATNTTPDNRPIVANNPAVNKNVGSLNCSINPLATCPTNPTRTIP